MGVYWVVQGALVYILWPVLFWDAQARDLFAWEYAGIIGLALAFIMALQAVLVMPVRSPRAAARPHGGGLEAVVGGAAIGGMGAYVALFVWIVLEDQRVPQVPESLRGWHYPLLFVGAFLALGLASGVLLARQHRGSGMPVQITVAVLGMVSAHLVIAAVLSCGSIIRLVIGQELSWKPFWPVFALVGFNWILGSLGMWAFLKRRGTESGLRSIVSRLFLGTLVEVAATIPIDVMIRRKTSCYCEEGTMWALTLCWGAGTLVLGPAVWLVPMGRRRRRWYGGRCEVCGYDMSGCMGAERCPECGAGWKSPPRSGAVIEADQDGAALGGAEADGGEVVARHE
jgi:hypothetical protein